MSSIDMDQYVGSAIRYITDHAIKDTAVYLGDVPEDFRVPSVYFPVPRTPMRKSLLGGVYTRTIHFECQFFGADTWAANAAAELVRDALRKDRCIIPCYEQDGSESGYGIHTTAPELDALDKGIVQMLFDIDHVIEEPREKGDPITQVNTTTASKGG